MMYLSEALARMHELHAKKMLPMTLRETLEVMAMLERICVLGHDLECDPLDCSCWRRIVVSKDGK